MDRFLLSFLLVCTVFSSESAKNYNEDYYWRDYEGVIPSDALQGGLDRAGRSIYIGQVLHENKLIPGKIHAQDPHLYIEWNQKEYAIKENVKILCTDQPQKFEWIDTKKDQVSYLTDKIIIKGGFESGFSIYIGRAVRNGETLVGKVVCGIDDCLGLYTTSNAVYQLHGVFQILTYNRNAADIINTNCLNLIDVRHS